MELNHEVTRPRCSVPTLDPFFEEDTDEAGWV